jgi:Fe2+ or Zn2+ uptake regulation protein
MRIIINYTAGHTRAVTPCMSAWQLKVDRDPSQPHVRMEHDSGLCRDWTGDLACPPVPAVRAELGRVLLPKVRGLAAVSIAHAVEQAPDEDWPGKLRAHGLRPSPQRLTLAAWLLPRPRHVTLNSLAAELERAGHRFTRTRLKRLLDEFVTWDLLQCIDVGGGVVFYDTVTAPHAHVYNVDTGKLTDLRPEEAWITRLPQLSPGTRLEGVQLLFRVRGSDLTT